MRPQHHGGRTVRATHHLISLLNWVWTVMSFLICSCPPYLAKFLMLTLTVPIGQGVKLLDNNVFFLQNVYILGSILWYLKSTELCNGLCQIFGMVQDFVAVWLEFGLEVLYQVYERSLLPMAAVSWTSLEQMEESSMLPQNKRHHGHLLRDMFGVVDGARLLCGDYIDMDLQNVFHESYTQSVEIINFLVYDFRRAIIHAALNYPGSWYDSKVAWASGLI